VRRWQTAHIKPVKVDEKRGVEVLPRRAPPAAGAAKPPDAARSPDAAKPPEAAKRPDAAAPAQVPKSAEAAKPAEPVLPPVAPGAAAPTPVGTVAPVNKAEVAKLIGRLYSSEAEKARDELIVITKQDFGTKARRWEAWWERHKDEDRADWLFEGLGHKETRVRASSEEELKKLTGEYFGYHYDLPRREREHARERWKKWWVESGRGRKKT
jgi:hypothetical protein